MTEDRFARRLAEISHVSLRSITENCYTVNSAHISLVKVNHMTKSNTSRLRKYILYMGALWQGQGGNANKQIILSITSAYSYKEKKVSATSNTPI